MNILYISICSFVILLGFEIRHRMIAEEIAVLKADAQRQQREIAQLRDELKKKQNIYEEREPPANRYNL